MPAALQRWRCRPGRQLPWPGLARAGPWLLALLAPLAGPLWLHALLALLALLAWAPQAAWAGGMPAAYGATALVPTGLPSRHVFDLDPALRRAQQQRKRLYLYLHASDCPYCRRYEAFLARHADELAPQFARQYLVYELPASLAVQADRLLVRLGGRTLAYADWMREIGDERARLLVYPSVWLLDARGRPLMQMPAGTGTFETVSEQLEILNLVQ
ncbi:thioredoxin family protein [Aquabacterium sp. OR-4]|uniref:thioredoxin family protein n=1 Tax=Aquabacterium sp. OR-4 TaxID=2978127 RepID=UPI0021B186D4|nr:thioredoxin family protein [Aquabacterium sp. OR-4]MDT7838300.1 thioredoxin family protein [Aquabacterium sp. OR-4]